ncbi:unnamed protein product [Aphanomyces euteiches]|uniref:NAD(P)-binding protein n=1 Tax=Aphanomyces euteiches TaxID=100861 RepID=A0A6G0W610_9STRA|nr:hypothetical protein Ae201684_018591 [Aphanomyces euteiches]KAH9150147.1 hypothetical protein AeRB84_006966 [Aphanomyces euteiches]
MAPLTYLITGANKGLGYEAARILAERFGNAVAVLLGTRSVENGKAAIAKMKQANPSFDYANVHLVEIDVTKKESILAAAEHVKTSFGNLHCLINNAGVGGQPEGAEMCFNVNVFGVYDTLTAFHPLLVPGQSSNIVVGSMVGSMPLSAITADLQAIFLDFNALDIDAHHRLVDDWLASAQGKPSKYTWPEMAETYGPYGVSKTMVLALARKWAIDHPQVKKTMVCPGYCATDLNGFAGTLPPSEGAERILFPIFHPELTENGGFYREGTAYPFILP